MPGKTKRTKTRPSIFARPRRRKFPGNIYTRLVAAKRSTDLKGASCSKIRHDNVTVSTDKTTQYVIIAFSFKICWFHLLSEIMKA